MPTVHTTYQLDATFARVGTSDWANGMLNRLYNAGLQERRDAYKMAGVSVNLYECQPHRYPRRLAGMEGIRRECWARSPAPPRPGHDRLLPPD